MQRQPPTSANNPKMTALIIVFEIHQTAEEQEGFIMIINIYILKMEF